MPFKANAARRHHIPKQRHKLTNWAEYDAALRQRGSLTVWFTEEAVAAWRAAPRTTPGGQPWYSPLAITTALTLRAVFRLALRQTESLIGSILQLLGLDLSVPDHSTLSRRAETLEVPRPRQRREGEAIHLLVDSTGLKLCGAGEWLLEKHGTKSRRGWRKLVWGSPCQAFIAVLHSDASFGPAWPDDGGECGGRRGARQWRRGSSRRALVCGGSHDPNHDAAMRIGGEAPGRRAHSAPRLGGHASARVAATSDRHRPPATRPWTSAESPCS